MFEVGDKVMVYRNHHDTAPREQTVTKVQTTYVLLDSGEKFTASGQEWGNSKAWFHRYIRHRDDDLLAEMKAAEAEQERARQVKERRRSCVAFVQRDMSAEEIDWLYEVLRDKGLPAVD